MVHISQAHSNSTLTCWAGEPFYFNCSAHAALPQEHPGVLEALLEDDLEDSDEESAPTVPSAQPCQARSFADHLQVTALGISCELRILDTAGQEDFAQWLRYCPKGEPSSDAACCANAQKCVLQRKGSKTVLVLDAAGAMHLTVPVLRCRTHFTSFVLTRPDVFARLQAIRPRLRIRPAVVVLTKKLLVTLTAYQCAPRFPTALPNVGTQDTHWSA